MKRRVTKTQAHKTKTTSASPAPISSKTFGNQRVLPRLPVPDLNETCARLIEWVQPLLSQGELSKTTQVVNEFQRPGGDGEKLQRVLIEWSQRRDLPNWLEPFWDSMYLKLRTPIAVNINFSIACEGNPALSGLTQLQRCAALITSALKFKFLIDREELEVEQEKGHPVCMMQFKRLFSTTRIPKMGIDEHRSPISGLNPTSPSETHIVVLHNGHFFAMDVLTDSGECRAIEELDGDLRTILAMGEGKAGDDEALGILTTANRDEWANARDTLLAIHPQNKASLDMLERSLFALCLDDSSPNTPEEHLGVMLLGGGNRWFDKSFQFIVCQNGKFGVSGEHSGLDGYPVHRLIEFIYQDSGKVDVPSQGTAKNEPKKLGFHLNDRVRHAIRKAWRDFGSFTDDIRLRVLEFNDFGKGLVKSFQVSPDAFVQLAIQLAQYKLFGECKSTYETVATRRFLHGRSETLRSVSLESVQFVNNMVSAHCDENTKASYLRKAAQKHVERMTECRAGRGVERHLFGLLSIYERFGGELGIHSMPKIFTDPGWLKLCHDTLSTSSPSPLGLVISGFGPVVDDGFGIVYLVMDDRITFSVSSKSQMEDQLDKFVSHLNQSLLEMSALRQRSQR